MTNYRDFDVLIVGASGLTGRLVAEQVASCARPANDAASPVRWAVSGRDRARTAAAIKGMNGASPDILQADLTDAGSLPALTRRARVVLNLAGPYTPTAANLITACVYTNTDYVDLSGELPLIRDVIARFHDDAVAARVRIVQMAGWDALPADLTTLLASRRAIVGDRQEGPGAAGPIDEVRVVSRFVRMPEGRMSLSQAMSGGTVASIAAMLGKPDAAVLGRAGLLLPPGLPAATFPADIRVGVRRSGGRVLAPFPPVPFLNAPVVHRTAALQALAHGTPYEAARYLEGDDVGPASGAGAVAALGRAWLTAGVQRAILGIAAAPMPVRRGVGRSLRRFVPEPGTGPSGRYLTDWEWVVRAEASSNDGRTGTAELAGRGHPGYAATAAMMAEIGLRIARGRVSDRVGCLTPALTLGSLDLDPWYVGSIRLT